MKESIYKNAYNFINNGPIWDPLALLELSQSPLCISFISFDTHDITANFYVLQVIKSFDLFDMIWKKVFTKMLITSLIMVRFEIRLHCWNCLSLLYGISFISFDTHDIRANFYVLQVIKSFDLFDMIWKKVFTKMLITSLIMVRFEIRLHCWNCLSLLYAFLLLVSTLMTLESISMYYKW